MKHLFKFLEMEADEDETALILASRVYVEL